ncbi:MAG TPA: hypothetical protein VKU41_22245 [Polyangiaceae bacterium]|nr:hypothetical protein [Polyangiaceae bacterium]
MRFRLLAAAVPFAAASLDGRHLASLPPLPGPRGVRTDLQAAIEKQPVCIGSAVASAGRLADVLYYRSITLAGDKVAVGYFAFFSEERPWGNNWLTWSVVPALAVDLVYSRALFVAPGLQRLLYGEGDVEGVGVVYDESADGSLRVDHAIVDRDDERIAILLREQVFALDSIRPTFYADAWSHQLGAQSARSRSDLTYVRCYEDDAIRPLPSDVARKFRIDEGQDGRAPPAHVEHLQDLRTGSLRTQSRMDCGSSPQAELACRSGSEGAQ